MRVFPHKVLGIRLSLDYFKKKTSEKIFIGGHQNFVSLFRLLFVIILQNIGVFR